MSTGPVVFAYDGSELARAAIEEAGRQLGVGRDALVVTVWEPMDVGFVPVGGFDFDATRTVAVERAAEETAADGVALAEAAGFHAHSTTTRAQPVWKGIVDIADEHDASVIVLGSHGASGLSSILVGSVAGAVAAHAQRTVLITHRRDG